MSTFTPVSCTQCARSPGLPGIWEILPRRSLIPAAADARDVLGGNALTPSHIICCIALFCSTIFLLL